MIPTQFTIKSVSSPLISEADDWDSGKGKNTEDGKKNIRLSKTATTLLAQLLTLILSRIPYLCVLLWNKRDPWT